MPEPNRPLRIADARRLSPAVLSESEWRGSMRGEFLARLSTDTMRKVFDKLIDRALDGDIAAIKLLLAYGVGPPAPATPVESEPVDAPPRSPAKVETMEKRAALGLAVHHPADGERRTLARDLARALARGGRTFAELAAVAGVTDVAAMREALAPPWFQAEGERWLLTPEGRREWL